MYEVIVWLLAGVLVILCVSLHYETIQTVSDTVIPWATKRLHNRRVIAFALAGLMVGHILEIWLYALAMLWLVKFPVFGVLEGSPANSWGDFLYFSSVTYTSLGDSALRLTGPARAIVASETLLGMMMIAWSASFTYLKMEQLWKSKK